MKRQVMLIIVFASIILFVGYHMYKPHAKLSLDTKLKLEEITKAGKPKTRKYGEREEETVTLKVTIGRRKGEQEKESKDDAYEEYDTKDEYDDLNIDTVDPKEEEEDDEEEEDNEEEDIVVDFTKVQQSKPVVSPQGISVDRTKNGTWFSMGREREIYVYSAFLDDREAILNGPVVRLIAVTDKSIEEKRIYCQLKFQESFKTEIQMIEPTAIGAGIFRHGVYFREYVMICPIESKQNKPTVIGITEDKNVDSSVWIQIQQPVHLQRKHDFCSCVSATYWYQEPYKIVEWMELHKLFGLSFVTIYNNSLDERSSKVFQHYAKEGFVDFRQSHSFVPDTGELTLHMHMSPVINDCVLRNMHKCRKIVVTDLDEMVVPRNHKTYQDLMKEIDHTQFDSHPARSYTFRNSYFFLDIPGDTSQPEKLVTLRHRKRMEPSPPGYSVKSIIDPQACTNMHNHFCWRRAQKHDVAGHNVDVNPDLALNQHYKKCHFDSYHNRAGECAQMYETSIQDDIMLKYKEPLIKQVREQLQKLGMKPI